MKSCQDSRVENWICLPVIGTRLKPVYKEIS
jgi:hypothetical protein